WVWASADGGETWEPDGLGQQLLESPPYYPDGGVEAVIALGGPSALVMLAFGTLYRTDDAGQTWYPVGRPPDVSIFVRAASAVLGPDRRLYVGLGEAGPPRAWVYRTAETHEPNPVASEPALEGEESLGLEVAPNPARGAATVVLTLARPSEVSAGVYAVLGRRVAVLHEGPLGAGRHALALDGAALPPGVYVVRVAVGGEVAVRTVTLLR